MVIAIDFDGTCVTHEFPRIGKDIGAVPILHSLVENGHKLILFTMRSGIELNQAVDWFNQNEIVLFGVNENPSQKEWTTSPKAYAQLYIDDAALGAPVKRDLSLSNREFIDWEEVGVYLIENAII